MASPTLLEARDSSAKRPHLELLPRLDEARRHVVRARGWIALCVVITGAVALLALMACLDYLLVTPYLLRAAWLVVTILGSVVGMIYVWKRWIAPFSPHRAAAEIERHRPAIGQRLRTIADYEDPSISAAPAHDALLGALRDQTELTSTNADFEELAAKEPVTRAVALLAVAVCIVMAFLVSGREIRLAAGRTLLLPLDYTTVTVSPLNSVVKAGESVKVEAIVDGRPIESAAIEFRRAGTEKWRSVPLKKQKIKVENVNNVPRSGKFAITLTNCLHDLEYRVHAGPRELPLGHITALQPLILKSSLALVTPPEYLGRSVEKSESLDLKVYEGSRLDLELNWSRTPAKVALIPNSSKKEEQGAQSLTKKTLPMHVSGSKSRIQLEDVRQSSTFHIDASTTDGIKLEPTRLKIRVIPDNKPRIELAHPDEQIEVTPTTEVAMNLSATDDLGLQKVGIVYQIGDGELETLYTEDLKGSTDPLEVIQTLMLEDYELNHQDQVSYYAFAEDNYFGKPRRSVTTMRFIDIRPYKRDFQMLEGEGGGSCDGCSITLEELIARQRNNLGLTFTASEQSTVGDSMRERLLTNEREIVSATTEFADGLALRGNAVPSLDDAIEGMEAAVEKLNSGNLGGAVADEQRAVTALVRARKNLRQMLSSSSSSSSACRTFDRKQRQKLRTPEENKQSQQQEAAQRRQQLNDLAKRQREWSEDVKSGQKSAQLDNQQQSQQQNQQSQNQQQQQQQSQQASSQSSSSSSSSSPSQASSSSQKSSAELAEQQQQMIDELQRLKQQISQLPSATDPTEQRAEEIAQQMQQSLESLNQQNARQASQQSSEAADQLDQLADHLAAMNSQDFMDRLGQAQRTAQHLARREEALEQQLKAGSEKPGSNSAAASQASNQDSKSQGGAAGKKLADEQRGYATQADMLAELLARLQAKAFEQGQDAQQSLDELRSAHPPEDVADQMRSAADALEANEPKDAANNVAEAARELDAISNTLRELRSEYAQPELDDLIALEQKIAELVQQLASARSSAIQDALVQQMENALAKLEAIADEDPRMAEALQKAATNSSSNQNSQNASQGSQSSNQNSNTSNPTQNNQAGNQPVAPGVYTREGLPDRSDWMAINGILQTKIQEMILAGAQMDVDESIPPEYKDLVEQYYRELSDDLRP